MEGTRFLGGKTGIHLGQPQTPSRNCFGTGETLAARGIVRNGADSAYLLLLNGKDWICKGYLVVILSRRAFPSFWR